MRVSNSKSCKETAIDWMIERQAIRIDAVSNMLAGLTVFCICFAVTAGL